MATAPSLSAADWSVQMIAQLRVLDPTMSAEIGTPERKIIDTVAVALSQSQIDLTALGGSLDINSKFGADLDQFLAIFGYARQQATFATGFVTFSRQIASSFDIAIPRGTTLLARGASITNSDAGTFTQDVAFITTLDVVLPAGQTETLVPIQSLLSGSIGNVAASTINEITNQPVNGVSAVTNPAPTNGGLDLETDDEYKIRFQNTVFRNVAGTPDQYLALAIATAFTSKAAVIGPISRYREYVQVPYVDDATVDPNNGYSGNGLAGQYTTTLSTNPYSAHIYTEIPYFVSNGQIGSALIFYRQDTDFIMNTDSTAKFKGDTYRMALLGTGDNPTTDINPATGLTTTGYKTTQFRPNITFYNVYTGADPSVNAIRPGDIVLLEYAYLCAESRNDPTHYLNNAVDVFIDGDNATSADAIVPHPTISNVFNANPSDKYYFANFRRIGEPSHAPVQGNLFTALFWTPLVSIPDKIKVGATQYWQGVHYWPVQDISPIGGTVRARDGIEWHAGINGQGIADPDEGPYTGPKIGTSPEATLEISQYFYDRNLYDLQASIEAARQITTDALAHKAKMRYFKFDITVMYNAGVSQTDTNNQISNSLRANFKSQYFGSVIQLSDILSVIHNVSGVDNVRWSADLAPTRHKVQECDIDGVPLLNVIVDQVQAGTLSIPEIQQFYIVGAPQGGTYTLAFDTHTTDPIAYNAAPAPVTATLASAPLVGDVALTFANPYTNLDVGMGITLQGGTAETVTVTQIVSPTVVDISPVANAGHTTTVNYTPPGNVQDLMTTAGIPVTVTGSGTMLDPYVATWTANGIQDTFLLPTVSFTGGTTDFDSDFYLQDNELPALPMGQQSNDTLPGLIIRPRSQGTWQNI